MKKLMFWMPLAAIALASCSNDEQVSQVTRSDVQQLTIRPVVGNATRSVITDANFNQFHVVATITNATATNSYAFWKGTGDTAPTSKPTDAGSVLTSLDLDVTNTTGKWETIGNSKWYWSSKNAEASFVGYNVNGTINVPNEIANQKDVLVAYNSGSASSFSNGVPMLFRHVLSQIVIKADNKDADIRQIKVAGVRIHNVGNTNSLTLPNSATTADAFKWYDGTDGYRPWSAEPATKSEKYTYYKAALGTGDAVQDAITLNASAQEITFDGPALLLPQTNSAATDLKSENAGGKAYFDILVQVQNIEASPATAIFPAAEAVAGQKYAWVAVPVDIAWNPGYKYTYVLHFSKDGIGKVSPDGGEGGEEPTDPGKEIVDNPVPLYFTVTIDEWNDASTSPEEKDL